MNQPLAPQNLNPQTINLTDTDLQTQGLQTQGLQPQGLQNPEDFIADPALALDSAVAERNIYHHDDGAANLPRNDPKSRATKPQTAKAQAQPQANFKKSVQRPIQKLSRPRIYLFRMVIFLGLCGVIAVAIGKPITTAFFANPGLNGLILGVLTLGTLAMLRQIFKLFPEVGFINSLRANSNANGPRKFKHKPKLLAPLSAQIKAGGGRLTLTPSTLRIILDSVAIRLDESREINRYLIGLLVFLGLLGTFWGLITTVGSIGEVIHSMQTTGDTSGQFDELKNGLAAPLAGMSLAFTSSLFGLAGSLILGFLDLQVGQAQNRFYTEFEDALASEAELSVLPPAPTANHGLPPELAQVVDYLRTMAQFNDAGKTQESLYILADSLQGLVTQMRHEQQLIRDWVEAQAVQQQEFGRLLARITTLAEQQQ